jgi:DNA-damage-inducible protein D
LALFALFCQIAKSIISTHIPMNRTAIEQLLQQFEKAARHEGQIEYWSARDLQLLLDYSKWDKFASVLEKAKTSCEQSGEAISDHFLRVGKMVPLGSGSEREIEDYLLTRYACYLLAQNGDPRKEVVAFAQTYFALQTRKQELIEKRMVLEERIRARKRLRASEEELQQLAFQRGVDHDGFSRIKLKGDQALFGGKTSHELKEFHQLPAHRDLEDFLPTITLTAKDLAAQLTHFNINQKNLEGEENIGEEHATNNNEIREMLVRRGAKPEQLPTEDDLKKVERQLKTSDRKLLKKEKKYYGNE